MGVMKRGLEKLRHDSTALRSGNFYWHGGTPLVHMPRHDATPAVATCFIINAVSLLDEGLAAYLSSSRRPRGIKKAARLAERIDVLKMTGAITNGTRLHSIRKLRNSYAHDLGKYGNWTEFDSTVLEVEQTFAHLGLI